MIETWCAHKIANLEGLKNVNYKWNAIDSLDGLDNRVRVLERRFNVTALPPMLKPTWESLEYRLWQLETDAGLSIMLKMHTSKSETVKELQDVKMVANTLFSLQNQSFPSLEGSEKEQLREMANRLSYVAGVRKRNMPDFDDTANQMYDIATQLVLDLEKDPRFGAGRFPGGGVPPRAAMAPIHAAPGGSRPIRSITRKGCCGCCGCSCHGADCSGLKSGPVILGLREEKQRSRLRNIFGFGWLRGLWCRRTTRTASSSSGSTSSTGTIVD